MHSSLAEAFRQIRDYFVVIATIRLTGKLSVVDKDGVSETPHDGLTLAPPRST